MYLYLWKIKRIIVKEFNGLYKQKRTITEVTQQLSNKTIINVDIQPEYQSYLTFNLHDWIEFINQNASANEIIFLYNGAETLGMISENDYKIWLVENGMDEDIVSNSATFYDKGYAFFRYCMDNSIDEDSIADFVKFMSKHDINDSRMMTEDMWSLFMQEYGHDQSDVKDLLESSDDMIFIPDLMSFISRYNNVTLTGGGINECLKEVEIALLALEKPFSILHQFTY